MAGRMFSSDRSAESLSLQASLFHLANGYVGIRGYFAERPDEHAAAAAPNGLRGVYLNGFYENVPLVYSEALAGFPLVGERIVSLPDVKRITIELDGERVTPLHPAAAQYGRVLDLARGYGEYSYTVKRPAGALRVRVREMVSFVHRQIFCQSVVLEALDRPLTVTLTAGTDADGREAERAGADPRVAAAVTLSGRFSRRGDDETFLFQAATGQSGLETAIAARYVLDAPGPHTVLEASDELSDTRAGRVFRLRLEAGETVTLTRFCAFSDSRRAASPADAALAALENAHRDGIDALEAGQKAFLDRFWADRRIETEGDAATQEALDFAVYTLLQSAASDGISLIPAKGLSGAGYEGHYFWDFEIYLFPFYLWTWPERAKQLLDYRKRTLGQARQNASILGYEKGAQYAWRTISGPESSAYFPAGSAQVHINADIALAFERYYLVTGDLAYMAEGGVDVLIETARTWLEVGGWHDGRFMIFGVTGPDEYSCLVDNNWYTNRAAAHHLRAAVRIVGDLKAAGETNFIRRTRLADEELAAFERAAGNMYLPRDEALGIDAQDDSFLKLLPWDIEGTPPEQFPLLLHFHPSKLYRHQVLKQADTVLAYFLFEDDPVSAARTRSRRYYEARTTHDSSLSPCVYGTMAALAGERKKAMDFFLQSRDIDLKNLQGNTADGLHLGNLGGLWLFVVQGYAGLRLVDGRLSLAPQTEASWQSLSFRLRFRGARLDVSIGRSAATLCWHGETSLEMLYRGRELILEPKRPTTVNHWLGLIFDLDGVLVHTDRYHYRAWKEMADGEGIEFNEEINQRLRGVGRGESLEIILEKAPRPYTEAEKEALAARKNSRYRSMLAELSPDDFAQTYRDGLTRLKSLGYRLAVASSSRNAGTILEHVDLGRYFDAVVDGGDIAASKPDPDVFLKAASRLGLEARDCLVIEDAAAGLEAAVAGRFTAAGFGQAADDERAALSFTDLDALFGTFLDRKKENGHG